MLVVSLLLLASVLLLADRRGIFSSAVGEHSDWGVGGGLPVGPHDPLYHHLQLVPSWPYQQQLVDWTYIRLGAK